MARMSDEYPLVSDTGKRYRMISDTVREYESGAQYNEREKRLVKPMITSTNAVQMQEASVQARYERAGNATRLGLVAGMSAIDPVVAQMVQDGVGQDKLEAASLAVLSAKMTELAYAADGGASVSAYKELYRQGQFTQDRRAVSQSLPAGVGGAVLLSPEVAAMLVERLAQRRDGQD